MPSVSSMGQGMSLRMVMSFLVNFSVIKGETGWNLGDLLVFELYQLFASFAFSVVCGHGGLPRSLLGVVLAFFHAWNRDQGSGLARFGVC